MLLYSHVKILTSYEALTSFSIVVNIKAYCFLCVIGFKVISFANQSDVCEEPAVVFPSPFHRSEFDYDENIQSNEESNKTHRIPVFRYLKMIERLWDC